MRLNKRSVINIDGDEEPEENVKKENTFKEKNPINEEKSNEDNVFEWNDDEK
jgi:hypothetical protein